MWDISTYMLKNDSWVNSTSLALIFMFTAFVLWAFLKDFIIQPRIIVDRYQVVISKASEIFKNDPGALTFLLCSLITDEENRGGRERSPQWNMLLASVEDTNAFKLYATSIYRDALREQSNVFQGISDLNSQVARISSIDLKLQYLDRCKNIIRVLFPCGGAIWPHLSINARQNIVQFCTNFEVVNKIMELTKASGSISQSVTKYIQVGICGSILLMAVPVAIEVVVSVRRWWRGEITAKQAAINVGKALVISLATTGGAAGGYAIGQLLGGFFGPIGMIFGPPVGALIGGVSASIITQTIIDALEKQIFNHRQNKAVARAYSYLGINSDASDEEVIVAYHSCCLCYHPDRNRGSRESHEAFCKLQTYFDLIRCSRDKVF